MLNSGRVPCLGGILVACFGAGFALLIASYLLFFLHLIYMILHTAFEFMLLADQNRSVRTIHPHLSFPCFYILRSKWSITTTSRAETRSVCAQYEGI